MVEFQNIHETHLSPSSKTPRSPSSKTFTQFCLQSAPPPSSPLYPPLQHHRPPPPFSKAHGKPHIQTILRPIAYFPTSLTPVALTGASAGQTSSLHHPVPAGPSRTPILKPYLSLPFLETSWRFYESVVIGARGPSNLPRTYALATHAVGKCEPPLYEGGLDGVASRLDEPTFTKDMNEGGWRLYHVGSHPSILSYPLRGKVFVRVNGRRHQEQILQVRYVQHHQCKSQQRKDHDVNI